MRIAYALISTALLWLSPLVARGQYAQVTTPFSTLNDNFFERVGVGFGFSLDGARIPPGRNGGPSGVVGLNQLGQVQPNINFNQGGADAALPPFGGNDPGANARGGFAVRGNEGSMFFNFTAGQGSSRSNVMQAPTVVIPNGGQGTVIDTQQRPFVTGVIPVVGGFHVQTPFFPSGPPQTTYTLNDRIADYYAQQKAAGESPFTESTPPRTEASIEPAYSSASHGDLSVADIRRQQQSQEAEEARAEAEELQALIAKAQGAEAEGKLGAAKIYYNMAARRATGELQQQLQEKLRLLSGSTP